MASRLVNANIELWHRVNKRVQWHKLPAPLQLLNLRAFRDEMREKILQGTAHLTVLRSDGQPIKDHENLAQRLRQIDDGRRVMVAANLTREGAPWRTRRGRIRRTGR